MCIAKSVDALDKWVGYVSQTLSQITGNQTLFSIGRHWNACLVDVGKTVSLAVWNKNEGSVFTIRNRENVCGEVALAEQVSGGCPNVVVDALVHNYFTNCDIGNYV